MLWEVDAFSVLIGRPVYGWNILGKGKKLWEIEKLNSAVPAHYVQRFIYALAGLFLHDLENALWIERDSVSTVLTFEGADLSILLVPVCGLWSWIFQLYAKLFILPARYLLVLFQRHSEIWFQCAKFKFPLVGHYWRKGTLFCQLYLPYAFNVFFACQCRNVFFVWYSKI